MKKLLAFVAVITIACGNCFVPQTYAETSDTYWARVEKDDVLLYANEDCSKAVVTLEKSYYLQIIQQNYDTLFVAVANNSDGFCQICGYVKTASVTLCTSEPLSPLYPTVKLTVTSDSASLKLAPIPSSQTVITATNTQKLYYYGKLVEYGKTWYYVSYANKFGYVDGTSVTPPQVPLHPTPLTPVVPTVAPVSSEQSDSKQPTTEQTNREKTPTSEIMLLIFVVLLAGGLTAALFLPGNDKRNDVFDSDI